MSSKPAFAASTALVTRRARRLADERDVVEQAQLRALVEAAGDAPPQRPPFRPDLARRCRTARPARRATRAARCASRRADSRSPGAGSSRPGSATAARGRPSGAGARARCHSASNSSRSSALSQLSRGPSSCSSCARSCLTSFGSTCCARAPKHAVDLLDRLVERAAAGRCGVARRVRLRVCRRAAGTRAASAAPGRRVAMQCISSVPTSVSDVASCTGDLARAARACAARTTVAIGGRRTKSPSRRDRPARPRAAAPYPRSTTPGGSAPAARARSAKRAVLRAASRWPSSRAARQQADAARSARCVAARRARRK